MRKHFILSLALLALLTACDDYLDIKPYGKAIPKTTEEFAALIHEMCNNIEMGSSQGEWLVGNYGLTQELEACTDNMATNLTASTDADHLSVYIGDHLTFKQSYYSGLYELIRNCNIILSEYQDGRDTQEGRDIIGTVYAIRGVAYYQLLRMFCDPPLAVGATLGVPIVTEFDMEAQVPRSTIQETIDQSEADLLAALDYDVQQPLYRFNNDVVRGYLARLYHWCGRWAEARTQAQLVLQNHPLISGDDYVKMMSSQYGLIGNRLIMADMISERGSLIGIAGAMTYQEARFLSGSLCNLFKEGTNDIRRKNNLYFTRKRRNRKCFFSGMRSAEMAFISMECAYHLEMTDSALIELNNFRRLRISGNFMLNNLTLPPVDSTQLIKNDAMGRPLTPLIQAILNERRKEFYLENGDRWFELKRHGRPEFWAAANGQKYWTRQFMYNFPLPVKDVRLQPSLIQNPGYENTY